MLKCYVLLLVSFAALLLAVSAVAAEWQWDWQREMYYFDFRDGREGFLDYAGPMLGWKDCLLIEGNDGVHGHELFVLRDLMQGPVLVADVAPGSPGGSTRDMTPCGDVVFFLATPHQGYLDHLWVTDGTPASTREIADIYPDGNANIRFMTCIQEPFAK